MLAITEADPLIALLAIAAISATLVFSHYKYKSIYDRRNKR